MPAPAGWTYLGAWEGIPVGYYCPKHWDALVEFYSPTDDAWVIH